jgi:hypothetical protein
MTRVDVYARALRKSQNVIRAEVRAATLRRGARGYLVLNPIVANFGPISPARIVLEERRTKELSEPRRAHSIDHAGLEVGEHRALNVL